LDKRQYLKFGGITGGLTSYSSIWLAHDHMLVCTSSQFLERYKRFYFKDIQALIAQRTNKSGIKTLIYFALSLGPLWYFAHSAKAWHFFWGILAGFFIILLIDNILKGPSCKVYIQTAVQTEEIKGLKRTKKFEQFLKKIRPLIQSFQGELDELFLQAKFEAFSEKSMQAQAGHSQPIEQHSLPHTVLFFLLIAWSLLIARFYFFHNSILGTIIFVFYLVLMVLSISAVVRQSRINVNPAIRNWAWMALILMGICSLMFYILMINSSLALARNHPNIPDYSGMDTFNSLSKLNPKNNIVAKVILLFTILASFLAGSIGLILSARTRSDGKPLV